MSTWLFSLYSGEASKGGGLGMEVGFKPIGSSSNLLPLPFLCPTVHFPNPVCKALNETVFSGPRRPDKPYRFLVLKSVDRI